MQRCGVVECSLLMYVALVYASSGNRRLNTL
jgi:hypothetical protein